ncbi:hypothetical protein MAE02_45490 [Microvirga aerophila]|uniref:Uncharacterized protein n=1 Tax=Microvirga aerophila TaxID=670291 RepID=A0A512BY40_9HYPH|nr:hypothetical protein MAE02_45490 [Microvirga aerophila]
MIQAPATERSVCSRLKGMEHLMFCSFFPLPKGSASIAFDASGPDCANDRAAPSGPSIEGFIGLELPQLEGLSL